MDNQHVSFEDTFLFRPVWTNWARLRWFEATLIFVMSLEASDVLVGSAALAATERCSDIWTSLSCLQYEKCVWNWKASKMKLVGEVKKNTKESLTYIDCAYIVQTEHVLKNLKAKLLQLAGGYGTNLTKIYNNKIMTILLDQRYIFIEWKGWWLFSLKKIENVRHVCLHFFFSWSWGKNN